MILLQVLDVFLKTLSCQYLAIQGLLSSAKKVHFFGKKLGIPLLWDVFKEHAFKDFA